jgi:hypothetical protein
LTLGGGLGPREVIEIATGRDMPNEARNEIPIWSTLHGVHARASWRLMLDEHWVVRASLEFLHCFASKSGIDYDARRPAGQRVAREVESALDRYLDDYYTGYVHVPLVGLTAAYRL